MKTYKGDCVSSVYDVINVSLAQHGLRIDPVEEASIEEMCQIFADVTEAELPLCVCGEHLALVPCYDCKEYFCDECRKNHCHPAGNGDTTPFRYQA